jgi:hypothetical protein
MATWEKIEPVTVTFEVTFTERSSGGVLKFEDVEGNVPGYSLKYGNRGAYFLGPKKVAATLHDAFDALPSDKKAAIIAILNGTTTPAPKRKPKSS